MKSWKKKRNYHRVRDENGEVTAHIITVDGEEVEVTTDVYAAYAGADRRERYIKRKNQLLKVLKKIF